MEYNFDGIIATNTTICREMNATEIEKGELSGGPLEKRSLEIIKFVVEESDHKLPVIGVGGIVDSESAHKKLDAGASLLQLYTSLIYNGPKFPSSLCKFSSEPFQLAINLQNFQFDEKNSYSVFFYFQYFQEG